MDIGQAANEGYQIFLNLWANPALRVLAFSAGKVIQSAVTEYLILRDEKDRTITSILNFIDYSLGSATNATLEMLSQIPLGEGTFVSTGTTGALSVPSTYVGHRIGHGVYNMIHGNNQYGVGSGKETRMPARQTHPHQ